MNILILGATGFIGSAVAQRLLAEGHAVSGLGRNLLSASRREPRIRWIEGDLRSFTNASDWTPLLNQIDAVVNCAGTLQDTPRDDVAAVQESAMLALYEAAKAKPRIRIVQISAARNLAASKTEFMSTKLKADAALAASGVDHVILRPALVLGRNAHGGSALLRALAAFPLFTPLAFPETQIETVSLERVAREVADAASGKTASGTDSDLIDAITTLEALVAAHRNWLGLAPAKVVTVPSWIAGSTSSLADLAGHFGWRSPMRTTAIIITQAGIVAGATSTRQTENPLPSDMRDHPAGVQDMWFARLYLFKPVMILTLALFWILSGVIPLKDPTGVSLNFGNAITPTQAVTLTILTSLADIALGIAIMFRAHARKAMLGMLALSLAYLAGGTLIEPGLWLDPLGPLVKVFPSLALTLASLAILEER